MSRKRIRVAGTYIDNGQTGTDFERPEWERMMEDAKKGRINCIVVKDLSRFARNYLEAGDYLEEIFPFLGVRFIAVNDQVDSAGELFRKKEWVTDFKNLANDYYSRDISRKVLSAFQAKKRRGEFIGSKAPYGYVLENSRLAQDGPAAEIVRRIFAMRLKGASARGIADALNEEGVSSPGRYAKERGLKKYRNCGHVLWRPETVSRILCDQVYIGSLVQGRYNCSIYAKEKRGKRKEDAWEIREGAHPALVGREIFWKVQEMEKKRQKNRRGGGNPASAPEKGGQ